MTEDLDDSALEALFQDAKRGMELAAVKKLPRITNKGQQTPRSEPQMLYQDPANWTRKRGIALIHESSGSLIGNYWEWIHNTMPETRRLVRSPVPIHCDAVETVGWNIYCEQPQLPYISPRAESVLAAKLELLLDFPVCRASATVGLHFLNGATSRVELLLETTFAEGGELLTLPSGTDILPVMNRTTKLEIRKIYDNSVINSAS